MATMARPVLLLLCVFAVAVAALAADKSSYTTRFDGVDVDRILRNDRVLTTYIRCVMEEGPCTAEGRELKKTLPDALKTGCSKCSEKQKTTAQRVLKHLTTARRSDWERLSKKFDPEGEYTKRYEHLLTSTVKP